MTPENQRDEEVKRDKIETFYSPEDKGMISRWRTFSGFGENAGTSLYELCVALTLVIDAQDTERQSWEREKALDAEYRKLMQEALDAIKKEKAGLEERVKIIEQDRDSWRRCAERLETEKTEPKLTINIEESAIKELFKNQAEELTRLKSCNEELEKKLEYFQSFANQNHTLAEKVTLENERLKAENERLRDFSKSYDVTENSVYQEAKKEISRLTSALARAHEALEQASEAMKYYSHSGVKAVSDALSDKDGTLALERWKRMEAVIKSVRRHLENGTVVTEERMAGCLSELEALDASEGGSDV